MPMQAKPISTEDFLKVVRAMTDARTCDGRNAWIEEVHIPTAEQLEAALPVQAAGGWRVFVVHTL